MSNKIQVRRYIECDAKALAAIYYNTIHTVNAKDYFKEQLDAWAPKSCLDIEGWIQKWKKLLPYVALIDGIPVGFAEFDIGKGYIDCFYTHHKYQGKGIGTALMDKIVVEATEGSLSRIYAEVSITARPFFQAKGFQIVKEQTVQIRGEKLTNFVMENTNFSSRV